MGCPFNKICPLLCRLQRYKLYPPSVKKIFLGCPSEHKKNFFTVRVVKHWNRLSNGVVEPPSLEILRIRLDVVMGNLTKVILLSAEGSSARWSPEVPANLRESVDPTGHPFLERPAPITSPCSSWKHTTGKGHK